MPSPSCCLVDLDGVDQPIRVGKSSRLARNIFLAGLHPSIFAAVAPIGPTLSACACAAKRGIEVDGLLRERGIDVAVGAVLEIGYGESPGRWVWLSGGDAVCMVSLDEEGAGERFMYSAGILARRNIQILMKALVHSMAYTPPPPGLNAAPYESSAPAIEQPTSLASVQFVLLLLRVPTCVVRSG